MTTTQTTPEAGRPATPRPVRRVRPLANATRLVDVLAEHGWIRPVTIVLVVCTLALHSGPYRAPGGTATVAGLVAVVLAADLVLICRRADRSWLSAGALIALAGAGGLLTLPIPQAWTIALPFIAIAAAARRYPAGPATAVVLGSLLSLLAPWLVRPHADAAGLVAVLAVATAVTAAAYARRGRIARLEQVELALAREQAARQEHARAAALAERARIARDMHDVLAHSLSALSLNLQGARLLLARDGTQPEALAQVQRAQRLAADGLAEARRAVAALREDPVPAVRTVADLVTNARLTTGTPAEFTAEGQVRALPVAVDEALLRIATEALTNAAKHSPGAPVRVLLRYLDDRVELVVTDHPGRRPPDATPGGYGLTGMRERTDRLGGRLCAGPTADGWRVQATVPA